WALHTTVGTVVELSFPRIQKTWFHLHVPLAGSTPLPVWVAWPTIAARSWRLRMGVNTCSPGGLELCAWIRDIPDFPKPGIMFKDITPLLSSPAGLSLAVEFMT